MNIENRLFLLVVAIFLFVTVSGCAGLALADKNSKREFTYDFKIEGKTKDILWKSARDYFANAYGDSREVFRVMDQDDGTIMGKGVASWVLAGNRCLTSYNIRFAAKDGKSRLQLEIIEGVPVGSECTGWPWPSVSGYEEIVSSFDGISVDLERALKGDSKSNRLMDF